MDQVLIILVSYRMKLTTIMNIQLVFVFNLKYQMMFAVIPKNLKLENDTTINRNFPICLVDINILWNEMGDVGLSNG